MMHETADRRQKGPAGNACRSCVTHVVVLHSHRERRRKKDYKVKGIHEENKPAFKYGRENIIHNVEHGLAHDDERGMTLCIGHLHAG
jgi:hypothetical protein